MTLRDYLAAYVTAQASDLHTAALRPHLHYGVVNAQNDNGEA